jgi:sensor histidine kinase YesM
MLHASESNLPARLGRGLLFLAAVCTVIALFLTVLDGQPGAKFIYSFAIGGCCWLIIDVTRLLLSHALRRRQRLTGIAPPGPRTFELGWGAMLPLVLAGAAIGPPAGMAIGDALTGGRSAPLWDLSSRGTQITLAISLLATGVTLVVRSAQERAAAMALRAEEAQREASEAQLRLLQSQLEPHMLFNTLANLRVLIGLDPPRAQAMLDRLIAFLRSTLAASRADSHPLADEFARIDDYLSLMQVRMGPRLRVALDLPSDLAGQPVPPLLLQPLVENAIRHGLEPNVAGGRIVVSARRAGPALRLCVEDDGAGLPAVAATATRAGGGFGLTQVRQRLATLHGDAAVLTLEPAPGGGTLACVQLPLASAPADGNPRARAS